MMLTNSSPCLQLTFKSPQSKKEYSEYKDSLFFFIESFDQCSNIHFNMYLSDHVFTLSFKHILTANQNASTLIYDMHLSMTQFESCIFPA